MTPVFELDRDDEVVRNLLAPFARVQPVSLRADTDWDGALTAATPPRSVTTPARQSSHRFARRKQRKPFLVAAVVAAALAGVMIATPAWALVRDVLPFWSQPVASQPDQRPFAELNVGAPSGMSPEVVAGETREVAHGNYGGTTRTLWVAPAKNGGFCELWQPGGGGCNTGPNLIRLGWTAISAPPNLPNSEYAGIEWIQGFAMMPLVSDVVIRFSDGSSVHPQIIWVSAPINAGFFAYDIPSNKQTSANHVTEIDAYDANGNLVKRDTIPRIAIPPVG